MERHTAPEPPATPQPRIEVAVRITIDTPGDTATGAPVRAVSPNTEALVTSPGYILDYTFGRAGILEAAIKKEKGRQKAARRVNPAIDSPSE